MNARLNSELIGYDLDVQRMNDYMRARAVQRTELAESEDPTLDEPLTLTGLAGLEGVNKLIVDHLVEDLIAKGYTTKRALLLAEPEQLATIPGVSLETADKILEQIRKQRT